MKIMNVRGFRSLFIVILGIAIMGVQSANGVSMCNTTDSDANLSTCFKNIFIELNPNWSPGLPDLGIPPMDPFGFSGMSLDGGSDLVNFQGNFSNIQVYGITGFTNLDVVLDTVAHTLDFTIDYPLIIVNGTYSATGHFIPGLLGPLLPFSGSGPFSFEFDSAELRGSCGLRNETDGTNTFLALFDCAVDITISDYSFYLGNLGFLLNFLLNSGRTAIFTELKPELDSEAGQLIPLMFNSFLKDQAYLSGMLK